MRRRKATPEEVRAVMLSRVKKIVMIDATGRSMLVWDWDQLFVPPPMPGDQIKLWVPKEFFWEEDEIGRKKLVWDAGGKVKVN